MAHNTEATRSPILAIAALVLLTSACMAFAAVPQAYADKIKPEKALLQMDNFGKPEAVDVTKRVITIDTSTPDTLFKLTITDRYSHAMANKNVRVIRKLMQVDKDGRAKVVKTVKNSDIISFRARGLKKDYKLICKTTSNAVCDANGKVKKLSSNLARTQHIFGLNAFKGAKGLRTLTVKSKKLTKKKVRNSLKGSSVTVVKVKVGGTKANRTYVKKYRQIFTKKNCGKYVHVYR